MRVKYGPLLRCPFRQKVTFMLVDQKNVEHVIDAFTYIHTYFIGSSPTGFSESILHYKIINQVHDNKNITMIKEDKGQ